MDIREIFHGAAVFTDPSPLVLIKAKGRIKIMNRLVKRWHPDRVPFNHNQTDQGEKFSGPVPMGQIEQGIGADDQKIPVAPVPFDQGLDRIDGVRGGGQFLFNQGDSQPLPVRAFSQSRRQHGRPLGKRGDWLPFVRWLRCGNKKQAVEMAAIEDMTGQGQVPLMHRIKGAAEQTDMLYFRGSAHLSGANLARPIDDEFPGGQLFQTHRSIGMQLGG